MQTASKPKKKVIPGVPIVVRLPMALVDKLDKRAQSDFSNRSMVVRQLLANGLKRGESQ